MILHPPFIIGPRLAPCLKIDEVFLSCVGVGDGREFREAATMVLDFPDGRSYSDDTLQSGQGGFGGMVTIFESYLGFLSAALESMRYEQRTGLEGENTSLFPRWVLEALDGCADEVSCLCCELTDEEGRGIVREELIEEDV